MAVIQADRPVPVRTGRRRRIFGWPLYWAFLGLPLWWGVGLDAFIWPILAAPMALALFRMRPLVLPRGFGLWLMFLAWVGITVFMLDDPTRGYLFFWRYSLYIAATIFFLYVYNGLAQGLLTSKAMLRLMVTMWVMIVIGGFLGMAFPEAGWHTPVERMLPGSLLGNDWMHDLVHVRFSQVQEFVEGNTLVRPNALFPYSNDWAAVFALLFPLALAASARSKTLALPFIVAISFVPFLVSGNRAAWMSVAVGLAYAVVRLALRGRVKPLLVGIIIGMVGLGAVFLTPLGAALSERAEHPQSNQARSWLYDEAIQKISESPILGYGAPRPSDRGTNLYVGTHGQIWQILFSHGIPALLLMIGFFVVVVWRSAGARSRLGFWANVAVLIPILQLPFYTLLPAELMFYMVVAAVALHEAHLTRRAVALREAGARTTVTLHEAPAARPRS